MSEQTESLDLDPRASLIEDLLSRQDDVIRQLEELDEQLMATIETIRPSQDKSETAAVDSLQEDPVSKAA